LEELSHALVGGLVVVIDIVEKFVGLFKAFQKGRFDHYKLYTHGRPTPETLSTEGSNPVDRNQT
jgi:hypothetical protein